MRPLFRFSEKAFRAMEAKQQHKKCFALLKEIFSHPEDQLLRNEYTKICSWMGLDPISWNAEGLEQRFHDHVKKSGRSIQEHDFLSAVHKGDQPNGSAWLGVHTYLDGLRSCHNVGSIIRTIEAFRLGPVHLAPEMMAPTHPQIVKTSMGTWQHVEIFHEQDREGIPRPWIAIETVVNAPAWNEWIYPIPCTLIVGNEERGISRSLLKECDAVVAIPLVGQKNSLNVANAFAIVAAEVAAQRTKKEEV